MDLIATKAQELLALFRNADDRTAWDKFRGICGSDHPDDIQTARETFIETLAVLAGTR